MSSAAADVLRLFSAVANTGRAAFKPTALPVIYE
jgi:hypothetical protein